MSVAVKEKPDRATIARFKKLVERARFELKLANDMASSLQLFKLLVSDTKA